MRKLALVVCAGMLLVLTAPLVPVEKAVPGAPEIGLARAIDYCAACRYVPQWCIRCMLEMWWEEAWGYPDDPYGY